VDAEPILVTVDRDLEDLVPLFLEQRKADLAALAAALPAHDFEAMRRIGHGMAGAGASYGFDYLSEVGARIVTAAHASDIAGLEQARQALHDYMRRLVVKFM
jgi:HPt (histidine-containing phosphotransfer) domain-containing protein